MLEKDRSDVAHQDKFLALMLDGLDRVDHTNIFAHLEGGFRNRELHELKTLLSESFEEELWISLASFRHLNTRVVAVDGQVLQEEPEMTFVCVLKTSPAVDVGVSCQILTSDTICLCMRVEEPSLKNDGLEILVNICDYTWLVLFNFIQLQILRQMDNLRSLKRQLNIEVGLHLFLVNSDKDVWVLKIPEDVICPRREVRNE